MMIPPTPKFTSSHTAPHLPNLLPVAHAWAMSASGEMPWSDNPNSPQILSWVYFGEKAIFVGLFIGSILFGTTTPMHLSICPHLATTPGISIALFFQCAVTLLDPVNRTKGIIKWGFVVHTLAMFSLLTIAVAAHLSRQSISYIDNREFAGIDVYPPGPFRGYQYSTNSVANVISRVAFPLNQWLVDGFLVSQFQTWSSKYLI